MSEIGCSYVEMVREAVCFVGIGRDAIHFGREDRDGRTPQYPLCFFG